jgi:hypothetical protein
MSPHCDDSQARRRWNVQQLRSCRAGYVNDLFRILIFSSGLVHWHGLAVSLRLTQRRWCRLSHSLARLCVGAAQLQMTRRQDSSRFMGPRASSALQDFRFMLDSDSAYTLADIDSVRALTICPPRPSRALVLHASSRQRSTRAHPAQLGIAHGHGNGPAFQPQMCSLQQFGPPPQAASGPSTGPTAGSASAVATTARNAAKMTERIVGWLEWAVGMRAGLGLATE